ncbi:hypothetical protein KOW79_022646 [Hemibagrus wyckioides]|uniref:Uncharacterized protein n=1 Tax=Hemibagrus wyckioides TaxID=337641 RepID=A0A9D3S8E6_9TELE|nr:hypothetical protein KOW79_022646 [Hemibagrus wyckioides]
MQLGTALYGTNPQCVRCRSNRNGISWLHRSHYVKQTTVASPNQGPPDSPSSVMDHRSPPLPPGLKSKSRPALPPSHIPFPFSLLLHH